MHDSHNASRDALADIIDGLRMAGYTFGTMEEYAQWRWGRSAVDLAPGPDVGMDCVPESERGCASFGVPVGVDRSREVCGRLWSAYQQLGGFAVLGAPVASPSSTSTSDAVSQQFEHGVLEIHPEIAPPCNVLMIPAK